MTYESLGIIGAGSWGTALALLLAEKGYSFPLWVYEEDLCASMIKKRENTLFLPGFPLHQNIHPTASLKEAVADKSILLLVVPTHVMRQTIKNIKPYLKPGCLLINASKGIENETLCTIHQILEQELDVPHTSAAISGPTFAKEIAQGLPSALVAAADTMETAERVREIFSTPKMKVFTSTDPLGVEIGGALKNVIAIATGICDGMQLGYNPRAALITRGLVEITRIGTAQGARPETFSGLSGMGDLVLTCTGDLSRNRNVGIQLGQGKKLSEITKNMKMVAEGIFTVKSAFALKNKFKIQAAIIEETYRVIYEDKSPHKALEDLMSVEIDTEFSGVRGLE
ncbi:MAG: NAD(P)-dependent glycerol-3-phosphate dehydrogenase [Nitrospinae bacterium]|nr:NAD(P)-dependent glycerol-3-phosphate dehydrogenase [Nitrospinota bacterium]MDA1108405.1 NAD(P)-dependent glycerol-3-phosphate dehydrogenase [Nitrospinota bacterium]